MLPVKSTPFAPDDELRWKIGVDRRHVAAYLVVALAAGFALGFAVARGLNRKEPPPVMPTATAATAVTPPVAVAVQTPPTDFHKVTRLLRADTLDVEGIGPVRMIGIETPDGKSPKEIYGKFGQNAMSFVERAALKQDVRLEFDPANAARGHKDDSGQTLAYVYTRDGTLLNNELLREGLAFLHPLEEFKMSSEFRSVEREAMQSQRGVWGSGSNAPPATSATATPTGSDKPGKVAPLAPSAIGPNIPAISGAISPSEPSVYISPADQLYHKSSCELLDKKKQAIGLSQARSQGYRPCSRCYPSTSMRAP
ncbi:MAG TPA: thermonuclease family protein [Blastocatellia bacterium]|nr:thermonuclease family protein [Blastocatellia bacterium]